ncbi:hypothetical protein PCE1_003716 [Barthelona sp. PCE]
MENRENTERLGKEIFVLLEDRRNLQQRVERLETENTSLRDENRVVKGQLHDLQVSTEGWARQLNNVASSCDIRSVNKFHSALETRIVDFVGRRRLLTLYLGRWRGAYVALNLKRVQEQLGMLREELAELRRCLLGFTFTLDSFETKKQTEYTRFGTKLDKEEAVCVVFMPRLERMLQKLEERLN